MRHALMRPQEGRTSGARWFPHSGVEHRRRVWGGPSCQMWLWPASLRPTTEGASQKSMLKYSQLFLVFSFLPDEKLGIF